MGIFSAPNCEKLRQAGDYARLNHWALYEKDRSVSREALAALRKDVPGAIGYLYDTTVWAQTNLVGRRKMLPQRSVRLLDEAARALVKVGRHAVPSLVDAIRLYDEYGESDERIRLLFITIVFDTLERIGTPSVVGLRRLARSRQKDIAEAARQALDVLADRGLLEEDI